jgi:hypothetical protein
MPEQFSQGDSEIVLTRTELLRVFTEWAKESNEDPNALGGATCPTPENAHKAVNTFLAYLEEIRTKDDNRSDSIINTVHDTDEEEEVDETLVSRIMLKLKESGAKYFTQEYTDLLNELVEEEVGGGDKFWHARINLKSALIEARWNTQEHRDRMHEKMWEDIEASRPPKQTAADIIRQIKKDKENGIEHIPDYILVEAYPGAWSEGHFVGRWVPNPAKEIPPEKA